MLPNLPFYTTGIPCTEPVKGLTPELAHATGTDCECSNCGGGYGACECNCDCKE